MANQRARSPGSLAQLNTQGQVTTKPSFAVDPNAGIWFTTASSLRRAGQTLGNLADRAMRRREKAAIETATTEGQMAGYQADLGTGSGNSQIGQRLMGDLQKDFGLSPAQAAGFVGNLAHESGGFKTLQEVNPTVPGSLGGFGYAQWTGDRRKQFKAFAKKNNLDPSSYDANYGFLKFELANTKEGQFLDELRNAGDAHTAAEIVSSKFLRPGIPNMASRFSWTDRFAGANGGQATFAGTGRPSSSGPALALRRGDTPMGEAYFAAQNRTIGRRLPTEVTQQLDALYEEHKDNPAELAKAFDEAETKVLGRIGQLTANDPEAILFARQTFAEKRFGYEKSARAAEDARVRDGERADHDENLNSAIQSLQKQAYRAANDEEAGASLGVAINETLGSIETDMEAGIITPKAAALSRKKVQDTVTQGRIDGTFDALPTPDAKANFVEDLKERWANGDEFLKGLSLEQVQVLENKYTSTITKEQKATTASAKLTEQKMQGRVKDDLASIRSTGVGLSIDGIELDYEQVKAVLGEEIATNWQHDRQIQAGIYNATAGLDVMSSTEMLNHLDALEPKAGSPGFTDQAAIRDAAQKEATRILKQRKEDPALAVDNAFDDLKALREKAYQGDPVALEEMIKGRLEAQAAIGIPDYAKAPLTNSELASVAMPVAGSVDRQTWNELFSTLDDTYGPYADEVMTQILHWKGLYRESAAMASAMLRNTKLGQKPSRIEAQSQGQKLNAITSEQAMNGGFDAVQWKATPNKKQIDLLLANPDLGNRFDDKFGSGASEFYFNAQEQSRRQTEAYRQNLDRQGISINEDGSENYDPAKDKSK